MDQTSACILLLLSLPATFGKYVYIDEEKSWHEAQAYCRRFHIDLAPVSNVYDTQRLQQLTGDVHYFIWIGLERNPTDGQKWTWSGGAGVSRFFWAYGQPNNRAQEDYGLIIDHLWHDATAGYRVTFFCYDAVVVREKKTWEEALEYCREHHRDLASVASDTEVLLMHKELNKNQTMAQVWIGLRFLAGSWMWVDGQPLSYEAWGQEGKPECPGVKQKCGALQVMGGSTAAHDHLHFSEINEESVWEAWDCEARLHFICY